MFRNLFVIIMLLASSFSYGQSTIHGSFMYGGIKRTYSFYVPASYVSGNAVPLVLGLHGTGSDGESFAQYRDFRPIADTANFIMVHPDGSTLFGIRFWNYGNVMGSDVDDVGFLEALIDTISRSYTINQKRIYCTGMSNGSFMAYYLACQSDRFTAIGAVTGSMSVEMYHSCQPVRPIPVIHIHGTADPTNPYSGTSTMQAVEDVVLFWAMKNNCDTVPIKTAVPDIEPGDGAIAERYLYQNGNNGHHVELFKVIGGEHTWPRRPMPGSSDITCMDFDGCAEIWRFFSQYERSEPVSVKNMTANELITVYPNPGSAHIYFQAGGLLVTEVILMDMQGRIIEKYTGENIQQITAAYLERGNYIARISGRDFSVVKKINLR